VRSFLFLRVVIGALGIALPFLLVFIDKLAFHGDPFPRDSLSVYYYSGMREVFVVILATTGFFLIAYKITEKNLDNTLSLIGGLAAITIALFATGRPSAIFSFTPFTPLQNLIGEDWTKWIHFGASAVFIGALGGISILFGRREAERPEHDNKLPTSFWRGYHFICAGAIGAAVIWIIITTWFVDGPYWSLLAGEAACAFAFGASWFMKGAEIDYLLGRHETPEASGAAPAIDPAG
jgi:hypothetical protein